MILRNRSMICAAAVAIAALGILKSSADDPHPKQETMVYELRTYTTHPGRLPALNDRFKNHTMQLFEKHGIKNVIYWTPVDQENTLIYVLAHKSVEDAQKSFAAFRKDPEWIKVKAESEKDNPIVLKVVSQFLTPTEYSPMK